MSDEITVSVGLETAPGVFLELEDETNGYTIGGDAFADRTKTRKQRILGEDQFWLSGEITVASAPMNTTETLSVWVKGATHFEMDTKVAAIEAALTEQLSYRIVRTIENSKQTWYCQPCPSLRIVTQREYLWATIANIVVPVPRAPAMLLEAVGP